MKKSRYACPQEPSVRQSSSANVWLLSIKSTNFGAILRQVRGARPPPPPTRLRPRSRRAGGRETPRVLSSWFSVVYELAPHPGWHRVASWCSWLSRSLHMRKVSGSNPDEAIDAIFWRSLPPPRPPAPRRAAGHAARATERARADFPGPTVQQAAVTVTEFAQPSLLSSPPLRLLGLSSSVAGGSSYTGPHTHGGYGMTSPRPF